MFWKHLQSLLFSSILLSALLLQSTAAFALEERVLTLYKQGKYKNILAEFPLKYYKSYPQKELYLLYHTLNQVKKYEQAEDVLMRLDLLSVDPIREITYYERIIHSARQGKWEKFLEIAANTPQDFENETIPNKISNILVFQVKKIQKAKNLPLYLPQILKRFPELSASTKILLMQVRANAKGTVSRNDALQFLFERGNFKQIPKAIKKELKSYFQLKQETVASLQIHLNTQFKKRNYKHLRKKIPNYLLQAKLKWPKMFVTLRELYFKSLYKSKRTAVGLRALVDKKHNLFQKFELKEKLIWQFKFLLRDKKEKAAFKIIQKLDKLDYHAEVQTHLVLLADHYYRDDQFVTALGLYDQVKLKELPVKEMERVQWYRFQIYGKTKHRHPLIKIALWARDREFKSSKAGARFCYWSNKLKLFKAFNYMDCFKKFPFTYYGLKSKEIAGKTKTYFAEPKDNLETKLRELTPVEKYYIDFIDLMYLTGESKFADQLLRNDPNLLRDLSFMQGLMVTLKKHDRFYVLQRLVAVYYDELSSTDYYGPEHIMPLNYPLAFEKAVVKNAKKASVPNALVYAVMREESRFRPYVKSGAGAIGLLQLMPNTAKYIGKKNKIKVYTRNLVNPNLNLRLGSAYLRHLLNRYDGNLYHTLAAYNGGGTHVKRWRKSVKGLDIDYFVESITFRETRNYVKRVMKSYYLYQNIYGPKVNS